MGDKIKKIKIKQQDGTMSDYFPIGADSQHIDFENGYNLQEIVGDIDIENKGSIAEQLQAEEIPLYFHSVAGSSATYIVQFPNGQNLFVDTGQSTQWDVIKSAIDSLGITRFDYGIITHFHTDHVGNIQNFIDTFDLSGCKIWVQQCPDFDNYADGISETLENYTKIISLFEQNSITPIVPENNSIFTIDENTQLRFLNTDLEWFKHYYGRVTEFYNEYKVNFNDFSLVTEIKHHNNIILATGDLERPVEEQITPYLHKCDIMTAPHHGVNQDGYKAFYETTKPTYAISAYVSDSDTWVQQYFKSYRYLHEVGARNITAVWTTPNDKGLFSFLSNHTGVYYQDWGEKRSVPSSYEYGKHLETIHSLCEHTSEPRADLTINKAFSNMNVGDSIGFFWWIGYDASYVTLFTELQELFGNRIDITQDRIYFEFIKGHKNRTIIFRDVRSGLVLYAEQYYENQATWSKHGWGSLGSIISETAFEDLSTQLASLGTGHYHLYFWDESGKYGLPTDGAFDLNIDLNTTGNCSGYGLLRNVGDSISQKARWFWLYLDNRKSPNPRWAVFTYPTPETVYVEEIATEETVTEE